MSETSKAHRSDSPSHGIQPDDCTDWCDRIECNPDEGLHISAPLIATEGGPMRDKTSRNQIDVTHTVGVERTGDRNAAIVLRQRVFVRDTHGWYAHRAISDLLGGQFLTPARARHLARLLNDAADEHDRITGGAQ
ncbi:hypothetical protein ABNF97_09335 [Plantactinospora sp. B6F1]|uniref:hypothetical protein n=1 Tax=Plantactinospora sp. B6F1 TaxID=3158971 RepID=UPI0032D8FD19